SGCFFIFDISGEIPLQTFHCGVSVQIPRLVLRQPSNPWSLVATKLVVTVTGEVLKVEKIWRARSRTWSFRVFKSMLLDQGITVLGNDTDAFIRNSIYFSHSHGNNTNDIFLFNLKTRKMDPLHKFDSSSVQFSRAQWFLPSFTQT
ncbi:hypothetical protein EUTSA_v10026778mg, partial [Eutrema salsugineum]